MLAPVQNVISSLLDQGLLIVPLVAGLCCLAYGLVLMMGDHAKGRQGLIFTFIGTAVALGSKTIAANIHP